MNWGQTSLKLSWPSVSILAEPPVTRVNGVTDKQGTTKVAMAYLGYLYSPIGQKLAAKHYYRPVNQHSMSKKADLSRFPKVKTFTVNEVFGGWQKAQKTHFADGALFDQISFAR